MVKVLIIWLFGYKDHIMLLLLKDSIIMLGLIKSCNYLNLPNTNVTFGLITFDTNDVFLKNVFGYTLTLNDESVSLTKPFKFSDVK